MKGIIFRSFLEFAERELGDEFVDRMLDECPTQTSGAFTNVGTYPVEELLAMVQYVLDRHDLDASAMQCAFGSFTFDRLAERYPDIVDAYETAFECIFEVDQTIHQSVRKLYPDAELPNMEARISDDGRRMTMVYQSTRPFMHMAHGLIEGCLSHFDTEATITMTDQSDGAGTHAHFEIVRHE